MTTKERFISKVSIQPNGCWYFTGFTDKDGYGKFWFNGRNVVASRMSMILHDKPIPDRMLVLHKCDCPKCVNPDHLFAGSQKDNIQDCLSKGRRDNVRPPIRNGQDNNLAKLTDDNVIQIRASYKPHKVTAQMLADRFGVCRGTIKQIVQGRIWKHLQNAVC